jgi:carboxymethylenebutenolidase
MVMDIVSHAELQISTADGACPTHAYHPESGDAWPAVIMYMDGIGMRPALMEIAERIALAGYYVLLPNLFYRVEFDARHGSAVFSDPVLRQDLMTRVIPSARPANSMRDTEALLAYLDAQPNVRAARIGLVGYCMGGRLALYAAGQFGDRVAAVATYHAGGLATDAPDSPHRLAPEMRARVYVAGAINDANFDDAQKARLDKALTAAGVDHLIETYNALHGFVPRDTPVHDEAATAKHWATLLPLLDATLKERSA